jgi:hypothetical protein
MRLLWIAAFWAGASTLSAHATPLLDTALPLAVPHNTTEPRMIVAQDYRARSGTQPRVKKRPSYSAGSRPAIAPNGAYRPPVRPGTAPVYRPGWRPPPQAWRPAYPGWRPGWAPRPYYGSYWRPGYGWATAAGLVAVGVLAATAASSYAVPPPPNPAYCWFYTDQTYQTGYWAPCPPAP